MFKEGEDDSRFRTLVNSDRNVKRKVEAGGLSAPSSQEDGPAVRGTRDISAGRIVNYSREPNRRIDFTVTASYDADIDRTEEALRQAVSRVPALLEDPAPFVSVSGYLNSSIEYVVRAWAAQADYWDAHFALLHQIKYCFDEAGIEMTYDHLNVHLKSDQGALPAEKPPERGENSVESNGKPG